MGLVLINFSKNSCPYHRYACGLCFFSEIYLSALRYIFLLWYYWSPDFYQILCAGLVPTLIKVGLVSTFMIRVPADPADPVFYESRRDYA